MNPASKSSLPTVLDPFAAAVIAQLHEKAEAQKQQLEEIISAQDAQIVSKTQALHAAEEIIQQLKEALRLERIRKFGKQSEKLCDLQLELRLRSNRSVVHEAGRVLCDRAFAREARLHGLQRARRGHSRRAHTYRAQIDLRR
jgi:hypothetical protein